MSVFHASTTDGDDSLVSTAVIAAVIARTTFNSSSAISQRNHNLLHVVTVGNNGQTGPNRALIKLVLLKGEKTFKPRPQNRTLVPLGGSFQNF